MSRRPVGVGSRTVGTDVATAFETPSYSNANVTITYQPPWTVGKSTTSPRIFHPGILTKSIVPPLPSNNSTPHPSSGKEPEYVSQGSAPMINKYFCSVVGLLITLFFIQIGILQTYHISS
ncbi:hypothetical protein AJ79_08676 [Helicocarpus griseus UAMH5409]|uniref:Uncharacterized protein n=1 Tax=Helicocarpus griseus UAMH5409 TaxID=1447875 RepID=A0A2B7WR68_9EURO|nr:hypothetical protein AJ79_08676 [Helicocarpus griseus UAMH5409]